MRTLLLLLCLSGCDPAPGADPQQGRIDDLEGGLRALNRAIGLSTAFLGIGVVDARAEPDTIALAIYQYFKAQTGTCAQATPTGNMVSGNLGNGCTLANADFVAGGTTTATVTKPSPAPLNVHFDYQLTVDGQAVTGTLEGNTLQGTDYDYGGVGTSGGGTLSLPFISAGIASGGAQLNGTGMLTGRKSSTVDVTAVHQRFDGCYPDEGSARLRDGTLDITIQFASSTPRTGQATLVERGAGRTITLPVRSGCPR